MIHKTAIISPNCFVGSGVVIDENVIIGANCFIGHNTVIRSGVTLGRGVVIGHLVVIEQMTSIERDSVIQSQSHITAHSQIGSNVFVGAAVVLLNEWNISKWRNDKIPQKLQGPIIKDWARIGTRALIMPGVTIGFQAVVGAGATITKNVKDREIWYGQQAECRGTVPKEELIKEE